MQFMIAAMLWEQKSTTGKNGPTKKPMQELSHDGAQGKVQKIKKEKITNKC